MISGRGNPTAASRHPPLTRGALEGGGHPGSLSACLSREHPHPPRCARHLPPRRGKAFGRPHGAAPTAANGSGALVRQSQARLWSRNSDNFCKPRAQWPGGNLERHSDFARRKCRTTYQEGVLRKGGRGKRPMDLGGTEWSRSQSDASPGAFWFLCRHGQRNSPPAGGEISHEKRWRRSPPI